MSDINTFNKNDFEFVISFGKFLQENVFVPVPLFILSPFMINTLNEQFACALFDAFENDTFQIHSGIIPAARINYLVKYTIGFELFKKKCMMIMQFFLQAISIILLVTLW